MLAPYRRKIVLNWDYLHLKSILNTSIQHHRRLNNAETKLRFILHTSRKVTPDELPPGVVVMGSWVRLEAGHTGRFKTLHLVYPGQEDAKKFKVSVISSVGVLLYGSRVGDQLKYKSDILSFKLNIVSVEPTPEDSGNALSNPIAFC